MKRYKEYKYLYWKSKWWSISIDLQRWYIGFWFSKYMIRIGIGPIEVTFYRQWW